MSRGLSSRQKMMNRDYGATSSSSNAITSIPDVNFSGFSPTEFMSLNEAIEKNVTAISTTTNDLNRIIRIIDSKRGGKETEEDTNKLFTQTNEQIDETHNDLMRLKSVLKKGDKSQKLQFEKLTSGYSVVVEKYLKTQQSLVKKLKTRLAQEMAKQQDEETSKNINESDKELLLQQKLSLEFEKNLMLEREMRVRDIEGNLLDINATMKKLGEIVVKQGEQIDTLENNIEQSATNVEEALTEVQKAANYRQSYRRKIFILLIIAVIIGLIVTSIVVSKLRS